MPWAVVCGCTGKERFQSAPGREAGRCLGTLLMLGRLRCFNPRPAVRPGDASSGDGSWTRVGGFNPRPAVRPGDAIINSAKVEVEYLFQSAPGREAGRCRGTGLPFAPSISFNPRPAVRPGDAVIQTVSTWTTRLFQSAPGREAGRCPTRQN